MKTKPLIQLREMIAAALSSMTNLGKIIKTSLGLSTISLIIAFPTSPSISRSKDLATKRMYLESPLPLDLLPLIISNYTPTSTTNNDFSSPLIHQIHRITGTVHIRTHGVVLLCQRIHGAPAGYGRDIVTGAEVIGQADGPRTTTGPPPGQAMLSRKGWANMKGVAQISKNFHQMPKMCLSNAVLRI